MDELVESNETISFELFYKNWLFKKVMDNALKNLNNFLPKFISTSCVA
jgi:hypothetical protein